MNLRLNNRIQKIILGFLFAFIFLSVGLPQYTYAQNGVSPTPAEADAPPAPDTAKKPASQNSGTNSESGKDGEVATGEAVKAGIVETFIYELMITLGGFFTWVGGMMLDATLYQLVANMGGFIRSNGMIGAINDLWVVIRDIFNIFFIFGLIVVGFKTILNNDEAGTRRALVGIIAAALLINFSLYATKAIVDFSNIAAYQIYSLTGGAVASSELPLLGIPVRGIAGSFLYLSQIASYADVTSHATVGLGIQSGFQYVIYGFFIMLLLLMAAFVFLAGAFLMISRFVFLVFSMILSPFMFLGFVFPQFAGLANEWWRKFLTNAFMAPAYIFMLYLSLKTFETVKKQGSIFEAFTNSSYGSGTFTVFVIFVIIMGFLYGSIIVAQKMGGKGAGIAMSAAHSVRKGVQGYAVRGAGRGAQKVIGGMAAKLGERSDAARAASGKPRGEWARAQRARLSSIENANFGAKTSRKDRKEAGDKEKTETARAHAIHEIKNKLSDGEYADETAKIAAEKAMSGASGAQLQQLAKSESGQKALLANAQMLSSTQVADLMKSEMDDKFKSDLGIAVSTQTIKNMKKTDGTFDSAKVAKAAKNELKAMGMQTIVDNGVVAANLTKEQLKGMESEFTPTEMARIKKSRSDALMAVATTAGGAHGKTVSDLAKLNPSELPTDVLVKIAPQLPTQSLRKLVNDKDISPENAKKIRDEIEPTLGTIPPMNVITHQTIKPGDAGYLPEYDKWRLFNIDDRGRSFGKDN